jgi:hypothetical protein
MLHESIKVGEKINIENLGQRSFDINELHQTIIKYGGYKRMSWGYNKPVIVKTDMVFRFSVNGYHHKGHVYIELDFMDTFNIVYTSTHGTVKKVRSDVYIDQLIDILDTDIERIDSYVI